MKRIKGTKNRPRLSVFRSNRSIYAQIIDDDQEITLVAVGGKDLTKVSKDKKGSAGKEGEKPKLSKIEKASLTGEILAQKAIKKGIKKVTFDRRKYQYHGRVKSLAEGARKKGLEF
jgi:large subunit ribosomal protein L18